MPAGKTLYQSKPRLRAALAAIPLAPGVYRFLDVRGDIVYIGKSVRLRDRVRSYFTGRAPDLKVRRLRQEVCGLDWQQTGSELEALLLESRLVKRHQPRFNCQLRDFVPLSYVRVDRGDPFPRLELTREPVSDGAEYFGPFRSQRVLESGIAALSGALRIRDCATPGRRLAGTVPCYRMELGTCLGPCADPDVADAYDAAVAQACRTLSGESDLTLRELQARMERAAERTQFELAARLRDTVAHVRAVSGRQQALQSALNALSMVVACASAREGRICLFVFRAGRLALQAEAAAEELADRRSRIAWARRLGAARPCADEPSAAGLTAEALDEIQIITHWMRANAGEGAVWRFPEGCAATEAATSLSRWLAERAAGVGPARREAPGLAA